MQTVDVLFNITIILLAAFFLGLIFKRFNQSVIIAYLLSGIIIGPFGLGLIKSSSQINVLSDIGIVLLMFVLGLSFPPKNIIQRGRQALFGGMIQVSLTVAVIIAIAYFFGLSLFEGFLFGSLLALSSTALVIKVLTDLALVESHHGRVMVSYLIVQDIAAVLMIAIFPSLTLGSGAQIIIPVIISLCTGILFLGLFLILNRRIIPRAQYWIAAIGGKELFLIGTIIFCLGTAVLSQVIGLSLALGAFIAGLIVSESEFNYQILAGMVPFRDTFLCIFFVALGMLLDPRFLLQYPGQVILLFIFIIISKFILTTIATLIVRYPLKTALLVGTGLAHIGPFSFILVIMGLRYNLVSEHFYNLSLTASLLTMIVTPFIIRFSPNLIKSLKRLPFWNKLLSGKEDKDLDDFDKSLHRHIIICGYGPIGIVLGRVFKAQKIPFVALELNARTVSKMKEIGIDCFYGDATSSEVLKKVHIEQARMVVITIPDPLGAEAIVKYVKNLNPDCYVLARSRFSRELEELYDYGADAVVQEEFETGLSILVRALKQLKVKTSEIKKEVETIRIERDELTNARYFGPTHLSKQLTPRRVIINLEARTKDEAIKELVDAISYSPNVHDRAELKNRVLEREEIETTSLGDGVAIPHARTDAVDGIVVSLGISRKGIDYGAIDEKPVHIIVLLVAGEEAHQEYLNTLASVAALFNDKQLRSDIIKCQAGTQVIRLLQERERALQHRRSS